MYDNMMSMTIEAPLTPQDVAKRMFYLAWLACGGPLGMGILQDRGSNVKEEEVWKAVYNQTDYPGDTRNTKESIYADYVFGRMMKFGVFIKDDTVRFNDLPLRPDYQAWCRKYPTMTALFGAALESLKNG
jgi:hypothetical protein